MNRGDESGTPPALRLKGLAKRFGKAVAVTGLDLDVPAGDFVCLVGPSGCGKTTVLRMISGLETPSAGAIEAEGVDITQASPAARGMGMVFQSYALFPNMSVGDNIAFGLGRGVARRPRVAALLEQVGLTGYETRRPGDLSGGQQQRVALARALAPNPKILLLDEPLSALDPHLREQLRAELKALQSRLGVTTIMVTHDQAEALALADILVVMRAGEVQQVGAPEEVYNRSANAFVASFIGPINLISAQVVAAGRVRLETGVSQPADTKGFAAGAFVTLAIRPQAVRVGRSEAVSEGVVTAREFAGDHVRLSLRLEGGGQPRLHLDAPSDTPGAGAEVGARLQLHFPPDHIQPFPVEAAP